jgi:hypothetical protein
MRSTATSIRARQNVRFFGKREGSATEIPIPALAYLPDAPSACRPTRLWRVIFGLQTHGRREHLVKCILIALAVSLEPQRQPHSIRGRGGCPRLTSKVRHRRSTSPEAAGRFGPRVKCARMPLAVSCSPPVGRTASRTFAAPADIHALATTSSVHDVGGRRPLRAYCEVRAHIA